MIRSRILNRFTLYFFNGLLVILPLAGTIYLLHYVYSLVNNWGIGWLPERVARVPWLSDFLRFPGVGVLLILTGVTLTGMFARRLVFKQLIERMESMIGQIPLVKGLYGTLKDTISSFIGDKKTFDTVVFVSVAGSKRIGFLTIKKPRFRTADGKEYVGVYFPQSLQFAGDLHWFEKDRVEVLELAVDEALRMVISAGVAGK